MKRYTVILEGEGYNVARVSIEAAEEDNALGALRAVVRRGVRVRVVEVEALPQEPGESEPKE